MRLHRRYYEKGRKAKRMNETKIRNTLFEYAKDMIVSIDICDIFTAIAWITGLKIIHIISSSDAISSSEQELTAAVILCLVFFFMIITFNQSRIAHLIKGAK